MEAFKADIQNSDLIRYPKTNTTELAQQYNSVLYTLSNFRAPLASKKIFIKLPNPIDRYQRQNRLTIPKLLLSILAIMGHYGRHSTMFYTVALKCTFQIILLLPHWQARSSRFSLIKSVSFALSSPPTHTHGCSAPSPLPGRLYRI